MTHLAQRAIVVSFRRKALLLAPLVFASCISSNNPVRVTSCAPGEVAGTWSDARMTQLGPARVTISFGCDCRYSIRGQLLWMRAVDRGSYKVEGTTIRFFQKNREWVVPFERSGNRLTLEEHPNERPVYTLVSCASCSPCSSR